MAEPITTAEAKAHLRVDASTDDALIADKIVAAREWVENYTGLVLTRRAVTEAIPRLLSRTKLRAWPIDPAAPVAIVYRDSSGAEQSIADAALFAAARPGAVYPAPGSRWPTDARGEIAVTFTAGYADASEIPQLLKQAMLVMLTAFYEDREGGSLFEAAERSAKGLCQKAKRRTL